MKIASGHEINVAWNEERRDVLIEVDPSPDPRNWKWISLTPAEARELGEYLVIMAKTCEIYVAPGITEGK
jgi:hypothetical protein